MHGYSVEKLEQMSDYALRKFKLTKLEDLRSALAGKQPVKTEVLYHVSLPSESAHTGHKCGVQSGMYGSACTSYDFTENNPTGL